VDKRPCTFPLRPRSCGRRENTKKEKREMSDIQPKPVFAITERGEKSFWTKIGAAFPNKDGSITVQLDALPVSGRLQIREQEDREERQGRGGRDDRR
jgi:hypothetical protein